MAHLWIHNPQSGWVIQPLEADYHALLPNPLEPVRALSGNSLAEFVWGSGCIRERVAVEQRLGGGGAAEQETSNWGQIPTINNWLFRQAGSLIEQWAWHERRGLIWDKFIGKFIGVKSPYSTFGLSAKLDL